MSATVNSKVHLSFVIPVYNTKARVTGFLEHIKRILKTGLTYEIIVVDHGSNDGMLEFLTIEEKLGS
jgi:glycosyltransferase involved in cell wall biosynthesis